MIYMKNTGTRDIYIDRFIVNTLESNIADGYFTIKPYFQPTGMTGGAGDIIQVNTKPGSPGTLTLDSARGTNGAALTGGSQLGEWYIENPTLYRIEAIRWYLAVGGSIGVTFTAPTGNTSMVASFAVNAHLIPELE